MKHLESGVKRVIVLGGSSGIGKAIAQRFAREKWLVCVAGDDLTGSETVVKTLEGDDHFAWRADVRNDQDIQDLQKIISERFGDFEVLINSIGVSESHDAISSDFAKWDNSLQVMLYGTVKVCRALVPLLKDGGRIIHITSIHYKRAAAHCSAYGMAKSAITQFTRSLALELAPRNILVNAVAPGFINTPMSIKEDCINELESQWFNDKYVVNKQLPLQRPGQPEEISGIVFFLAGPDATYITGSVITADGGLTITF